MEYLLHTTISRMPWAAWHILATECRDLGPQVATSKSLDLAIGRIISDVGSKAIRDFLKTTDPFKMTRHNGRGCSSMFMDFLLKLKKEMALQGAIDISPLQAVMLLYDHDLAEGAGQRALRLVSEQPGLYSLVSTLKIEEQRREHIRVRLTASNRRQSWKIVSRHDRPINPEHFPG